MKPREPRRKVLIKARMRMGGTWQDVCVRNMSSGGMLLQCVAAPCPGTYIEVHRGRHAIVGRVAWADGTNFGVQAQDRIDVDAVIREPDHSGTNFHAARKEDGQYERRRSPRPPAQAERSREAGRALEFASSIAFAFFAAATAFAIVGGTLASPLESVREAFEGAAQSRRLDDGFVAG